MSMKHSAPVHASCCFISLRVPAPKRKGRRAPVPQEEEEEEEEEDDDDDDGVEIVDAPAPPANHIGVGAFLGTGSGQDEIEEQEVDQEDEQPQGKLGGHNVAPELKSVGFALLMPSPALQLAITTLHLISAVEVCTAQTKFSVHVGQDRCVCVVRFRTSFCH